MDTVQDKTASKSPNASRSRSKSWSKSQGASKSASKSPSKCPSKSKSASKSPSRNQLPSFWPWPRKLFLFRRNPVSEGRGSHLRLGGLDFDPRKPTIPWGIVIKTGAPFFG